MTTVHTITKVSMGTRIAVRVAVLVAVYATSLAVALAAVEPTALLRTSINARYEGPATTIQPGGHRTLGRYSLNVEGGSVKVSSVEFAIQAKRERIATFLQSDLYVAVSICGDDVGYGYSGGGYGYDGCQFFLRGSGVGVGESHLIRESNSSKFLRFDLPEVVIGATDRAMITLVASVESATAERQQLRASLRRLQAEKESGGRIRTSVSKARGQWRDVAVVDNQVVKPGDVYLMPDFDNRTLFYLGEDEKRYAFPNHKTYKTWYPHESDIRIILGRDGAHYPIGGNVLIRPGTHLVKIATDPSVYAVTPGGVLQKIDSEAAAEKLYGENWGQRVIDVPDAFFASYTHNGVALSGDVHPDGTLIRHKNDTKVYLIEDGKRRRISDKAFVEHRFDRQFVVENVDRQEFKYKNGRAINRFEPALAVPAGTVGS